MSLGLAAAGFDVIVGIDHDADALRTHAGLCPGWTVDGLYVVTWYDNLALAR